MTNKLFTDGGSRGNPGPGGAGVVLLDSKDQEVATLHKFLGTCTNNEAEYMALLLGLTLARKHNAQDIQCHLDSELIVKQLKGEYRVKNARLKVFYDKVRLLVAEFDSISFKHIPRDENAAADALVNLALDNQNGN